MVTRCSVCTRPLAPSLPFDPVSELRCRPKIYPWEGNFTIYCPPLGKSSHCNRSQPRNSANQNYYHYYLILFYFIFLFFFFFSVVIFIMNIIFVGSSNEITADQWSQETLLYQKTAKSAHNQNPFRTSPLN